LGNIFGIVFLVTDLSFDEVVLQVAVTFAQEIPNIHQMRLHLACVGEYKKSPHASPARIAPSKSPARRQSPELEATVKER